MDWHKARENARLKAYETEDDTAIFKYSQWAAFCFETEEETDPKVLRLKSGKQRRRCQGCGRRVLKAVRWYPRAVGRAFWGGYFCARCAYEREKADAASWEKPCVVCGRIVDRAYNMGKRPLCPECAPKFRPLLPRYHSLGKRGAKRVDDLPFTLIEFAAFLDGQPKECHWCGDPVDDNYHLDHVIPVSRGGKSSLDNLVISCPACNLSKGDKLPSEWDRGNAA